MRPNDLLHETWSALSANKGRSALTILGIVIGIGAVITMNAIIGGISASMNNLFGANAARILTVRLSGVNNYTMDDLDDIPHNVHNIEKVIPDSSGNATVTYKKLQLQGSITGTTTDFFSANGYKTLQGKLFTDEDNEQGARVVVIDQYTVKNIFGSMTANAVGNSLQIGNDDYLIVGVTDKIGSWSNATYDPKAAVIAMPFNTANTRVVGTQTITSFSCLTTEGSDADAIATETEKYLTERYKLQDSMDETSVRYASVNSNKQMMDSLNQSTASFGAIMVTVSGISLLVGGIGIMNMMLTNVTERIREIGLRKALGAKRSDITRQFMLESVCLCLTGGFIGVVLGLLGAFVLSSAVGNALSSSLGTGDPIMPAVDPAAIIYAVLVCVVTGLVFGWYPARRAARLDPVESLNHQ